MPNGASLVCVGSSWLLPRVAGAVVVVRALVPLGSVPWVRPLPFPESLEACALETFGAVGPASCTCCLELERSVPEVGCRTVAVGRVLADELELPGMGTVVVGSEPVVGGTLDDIEA